MVMNSSESNFYGDASITDSLNFLSQRQVEMIDEALAALGDYGELRLVVEKGRLRFLITQKSFDALKWRPGTMIEGAK
jgi:hypothetical protein